MLSCIVELCVVVVVVVVVAVVVVVLCNVIHRTFTVSYTCRYI